MPLVTQRIEPLYYERIDQASLKPDQHQKSTIQQLQSSLDLLSKQQTTTLYRKLENKFKKPKFHTLGLYLVGPVGRGKTMLMDLFCQCLNPDKHLRLHFHHFMEMVHQQLFLHSGEKDPLAHIALLLSQRYRVICFDEFFVTDIGDAMLLGRLYKYLFTHRVFIISTSNTLPKMLYHNGLHRDRFLPAITLIQQQMKTIDLGNGLDHRHRKLTIQPAYFINNEAALRSIFQSLTSSSTPYSQNKAVTVCNRPLNCLAYTTDSVWFDFAQLCQGPRSARDYIHLASRYKHIFLSDVPRLSGTSKEQIKARGTEDGGGNLNTTGLRNINQSNTDDSARRFISLVDELYDCRINLFISAECTMEELYKGELLSTSFKRTLSRLHEMSSAEYQNLTLDAEVNAHGDCYAFQHQTLSLAHDPE